MERSYYNEKGDIVWEKITDFAPLINENDDRQKDGTNGFTPERNFRHIGSIPVEAFHRWAVQANYYRMDKIQRNLSIRKYLSDHPEYRTVQSLVTHGPSDCHIMVK